MREHIVPCFFKLDFLGPTLSFGNDEDDGEDFKVKKSKASRMIKKMRQAPNVLSALIDVSESVESSAGSFLKMFFIYTCSCLISLPISSVQFTSMLTKNITNLFSHCVANC
jgi:hypothetical protein